MKKTLLLLTILSFIISCSGQGKNNASIENSIIQIPQNLPDQNQLDKYNFRKKSFKISEVIGQDTVNDQEYVLYKIDTTEKHFNYGNSIQFNAENTFNAYYRAPCGNDCFPSSTGKYFFSDENHILIQVKQFQQHGDCEAENLAFNNGFVKYYINPISNNNFKLIKSNGNLNDDSLNVKYSAIIDKYIEEVKNGSSALLDYKTIATDNISRVNDFIKNRTTIKKYKVLYSKKVDDVSLVNLVENLDIPGEYFFIVNGFRNNYEFQVGYYKLKE